MFTFLRALGESSILPLALLACVSASLGCGIVGSYVTVRRITYIAGAISHCLLGGIGVALYLHHAHGLTWLTPMHGAIAAAIVAAAIIGILTLYGTEREDTVLSAVWSVGMAIGLLFFHLTPGYAEDLMSYLFGDILLVSGGDIVLIVVLDVIVLGIALLFYNRLLAVSFDESYAELRGINVRLYYLLLLLLTALTVVLLVQVVGIVLVIALLTLPAAAAAQLTRRLWQTIVLASLITLISTTGGLAASYGPELPTGPTIIIVAGTLYLLVLVGSRLYRAWRRPRSLPSA